MLSRRKLILGTPLLPAPRLEGGCQTNASPISPGDFAQFLAVLERIRKLGFSGFETSFRNVHDRFDSAGTARAPRSGRPVPSGNRTGPPGWLTRRSGPTTSGRAAHGVEGVQRRMMVEPGKLYRSGGETAAYRQRFLHSEANLKFLDCGEFHLPAGLGTGTEVLPDRESLLFMWKGRTTVNLAPERYELNPYDTLYVPRGTSARLENPFPEPACLIRISAPAERVHPPFHSRFAEISQREDRIRRLKGKDVYMMFDVVEAADKLVAGYTFFLPCQRSWPPHNHTDQEEVYFFIKGHGSMEVYEAPETLSFVHDVAEGDLVTIPMLNYHPVFSQESPLEFIWCIAGERYWVGDKNKSFMSGTGTSLTT